MNAAQRGASASERDRDFRLIFCVAYPLFLAAALVARLMPGRRGASAPRERRRSIFAEASAAAYRTLPYAF